MNMDELEKNMDELEKKVSDACVASRVGVVSAGVGSAVKIDPITISLIIDAIMKLVSFCLEKGTAPKTVAECANARPLFTRWAIRRQFAQMGQPTQASYVQLVFDLAKTATAADVVAISAMNAELPR